MTGEINILVVYCYMFITVLCLVLITVFTISKSGFSNFSNATTHNYTLDEIMSDWNSLNCRSFKPSNRDIMEASTRGNNRRLPKAVARQNAMNYLQNLAARRGCVNGGDRVSATIPAEHMPILMELWKNTKCGAPFPTAYIESLYNEKLTFNSIQSRFKRYISDMEINLLDNKTETELLSTSFKKCHGDNWRDNTILADKFNILNSLT